MEERCWFFIYVLYSLKDKKLYIGFTKNLKQRVQMHNDGLNTSTKGRRPLMLVFAESFMNENDARSRELFFKSGRGREILNQMLENTFKEL